VDWKPISTAPYTGELEIAVVDEHVLTPWRFLAAASSAVDRR
jgi:hypothetical protein